jgi:pyrimidine and pyridine-specific 5'-nucleotidase
MNTAIAYMVSLGLSDETASTLRSQYYTQYGLTLRGLRRHHGVGSTIPPPLHPGKALILYLVDPLVYDKECDGSLPLEDLLIPDPYTRKLLENIDRSKCRVWALTNANQPVRLVVN